MNQSFLMEMLQTCSVSGKEYALQKKVKSYMADFAQVSSDTTGNVYGRINPNAKTQVLLSGHIDEIGLMVSGFTKDGFIKVIAMGGIMAQQYLGQKVRIDTAKGVVYGAVGNSRDLHGKKVDVEDLWIDIGATSDTEAQNVVALGDRVIFDTDVRMLLNNRITARAMDDRIGAFIVIEALRKASEQGAKGGIIVSSTVGEETNMRGAYAASATFAPTCAIAVDVTYTYDYPHTSSNYGEVNIGDGPVLCNAPIVNLKMNDYLRDAAKRANLHVQWEPAGGHTGTDADKMFFTQKGTPVALVSIPLRYMHSPAEMGSLDDIQGCIDLLAEFLMTFDETCSLNPLD